jgi:predicted alpha/beta superfamily hydrolase
MRGGKLHAVPFSGTSWLLPERNVRVWTPPGYETHDEQHYPTLYAHDGQWLMDNSWRSWRLQDTLAELITREEIEAPIVVMVDSVPPNQPGDVGPDALPLVRRRWAEYKLDLPGPGAAYLSFLCDKLKPEIDRAFRTRPAPEHTHALGASMGGLCAFLSMYRRPDVFGNAACLSPVFQAPLIADVAVRGAARFESGAVRAPRVYIDNGGDTYDQRVDLLDGLNEGGYFWLDNSLQPSVDAMVATLRLHEPGVDLVVHREPGGRHTERAFGARAARPLRHLLRADPDKE